MARGRAAMKASIAAFRLMTRDRARLRAFYREAFGFAVTMTFDEPTFLEHVLALPGQERGPNLMLVQYRDGRAVVPGHAHGPVGLFCDRIADLYASAIAAGAAPILPPFEAGGATVALVKSPDGHEIELVQLPA